jgi:NAD(P)-dependent dehydrogenase (short-subunit alcohol dehydrogenase family)
LHLSESDFNAAGELDVNQTILASGDNMDTSEALADTHAFSEKTVIVTGGGYGIGKQIALSFGRLGANVVVAARSESKLEQVAEQLRGMKTDPLALAVDIGTEKAVRAMVDTVMDRYSGIDVLINNAAIAGPTAMIPDIESDDWRQAVDINLSGTFYCCKYVSRVMREAKSGNIITLSSVAGRTGYPLRAPYAVTRWGVIGLSHTLAAELGPHGVRVNTVVPGPIEGDRSNRVFEARAEAENVSVEEIKKFFTKDIPIGRMPTEQEVANCVTYLASDASVGIHGQTIQVDGGFRMQ